MENSSVIDRDTTKSGESQQILKPSNLEPTQPKPTQEPTRHPLGEITNTSFSPKKAQAQPVWKRITRNQATTMSPELKLPSKRAVSQTEEPEDAGRKHQEIICVDDGNVFISATAVRQPRQSQ